ncbi:MAG: leucine-rich repeat domain-containing protein, partial [Lachnospiraceae bacterium]|nr:leucine-rich repeat domain-containing protein [Lachnospiraceae bacterium]
VQTAVRDDYVPQTFNVTFWDWNNDDEAYTLEYVDLAQHDVIEDEKAKEPAELKDPEWVFDAWYTEYTPEGGLSGIYDFDLPVTGDLKLYAGWKKKAGSGKLFPDQGGSGFLFTINEDGKTATIARNFEQDPVTNSYTQIDSDLKIPEIVSESGIEYTVTGVGESAFENKGYMGELILPDTLTDIGNRAFCGCVDLTGELQLPDTLKTIGDSAFMMEVGGSKLSGPLNFGSSLVSIGNSAFEYCEGFTGDLILPDTLEKVGDYAFSGCTGFGGKIKLGNKLKTIGKYAFAGDRNSYVFSKYTGGIEIPATVTSIGERAFNNGQSLEGVLSIPLSGNLVSVGDYAFYSCSKLKGNLTFPQTLRTIGERAFADCKGLTGDLLIPDGVTVIGGGAFGSCTGLGETLTIGESVERVDKMEESGTYMELLSFMNCSGIKRVINKSDKVQVDLTMTVINNEIWTDAAGNTIKTIGKGVAYRSDYTGERIDPNDPNNPGGSVSGNVASDVKEEEIPVEGIEGVDKVKIVYPHKIPFFGKSKIGVEYFTKDGAKFTVSFNGQEYAVTKIKVNKKKKKIQITKLENADKKAVKAIKKATKGENGLDYDTAPYVVSDSDNVIVKFNKKIPDTVKSAKVMINNKYFNIKNKNDCLVFNPVVNAVTFKHDDVIGSSTTFTSK